MDDDFSNVHPQSGRSSRTEKVSGESSFSVTTAIFLIVAMALVYAIAMYIRREILLWRERSYKLATRRRHGIPDSDRRPFNVAYAAAMVKREEKEKEASGRARRQPLKPVQDPSSLDQPDVHADQSIRQRPASDRRRDTASVALPGAYRSSVPSHHVSSLSRDTYDQPSSFSPTRAGFSDSHNARRRSVQPHADNQATGHDRHASRKIIDLTSDGDGRKRGFDENDSDEGERAKKSRVEGGELIDGDEDASWEHQEGLVPKRASKRSLGDEDEGDDSGSKKARDKRARKVSLDKVAKSRMDIGDMDVDEGEEDDDVPDMVSSARGKKRDRAEAGSTFGGDDDDSSHEDDAKARRRRRKRQTVAKRKSDAGLMRGQKRDRDMDIDDEVDVDDLSETGTSQKIPRKKKGKRHSNVHQDFDDYPNGSDISLDDSMSSSTKGRGRRIGDVWENNGVKYKIGPNGQRLRQALVKKARHKFVMPQDSTHPDRNANLEVFVESWLTEEEYQDAKDHLLLAWQDSPKHSMEPENLSVNIPPAQPRGTPPTPVGKNLLWQSTTTVNTPNTSPASASPLDSPIGGPAVRPRGLRNPHRYSLASNVGLHINPFERSQTISTKRLASASRASLPASTSPSPGLYDNTNKSTRPRTLSKWERQEIEASAISQLRSIKQAEIDAKLKVERERAERERALKEQIERQRMEKERVERERAERERKEREAAAAAAAASAVPTITVTKPSESDVSKPPSTFSFPPPPSVTPSSSSTGTGTADALKATFFAPPTAAGSTSSAPKSDTKPTSPSQPSGNPLFSYKTPAAPTASGSGQSLQSPSTFAFGPPSNTSTGKPANSPFGPPTSSSDAQKKNNQQGDSLFSRLAPSTSGGGEPQKQTNATSGSVPSSSAPSFSFPKPGGNSTSMFSPPATTAQTSAQNAGSTAPKFSFFPQGQSGKPATSAAVPPPVTAVASSSLSGALGLGQGDAGKSGLQRSSLFAFKPAGPATEAGKESAMDGASGSSSSSTMAPKFKFGGPTFGGSTSGAGAGGTSAFGPTSGNPPSAFGSTSGNPPSAFGSTSGHPPSAFGNTGGSGASPFGSTSNPPSLFGSTSGNPPSAFGSTGTGGASAFGAQPAASSTFDAQSKGKEPVKNTFGGFGGGNATNNVFGGGSAFGSMGKPANSGSSAPSNDLTSTESSMAGQSSEPSKAALPTNNASSSSKFAFNASASPSTLTPSSSTPTGNPNGFSFNFAANTTTPQSSPFGAPSNGSQNIFGAASKPATAFGFGTPPTMAGSSTTPANTPSVFNFGAPAGSSSQQAQ